MTTRVSSDDSRLRSLGLDREFWTALRGACDPPPLALVLFGSFARGEEADGSDIDLLVVFASGTAITRRFYRRFDGIVDEARFDRRISLHLVALPEGPDECGSLWLEVATDGVVLFEEEPDVSRLLHTIGESVASGDVRRALVHGHPYWVREGRAG
jgi:predicted nucleotidyltransferase